MSRIAPLRRPAAVVLLVLCGAVPASAQTQDLVDWLTTRLAAAAADALEGGAALTKQVETPSVASSSTALVDHTGAPDLVGLAMQFLNVGRGSDATPASITLSAFALRNAFSGANPMRPEVFAAGRTWRRFSGTVGRQGEDAARGQPEAQILGVKALVWDRRDPTHPANVRLLQDALAASDAGRLVSQAADDITLEISRILAPRFGMSDPVDFMEKHLGAARHAETLARLTADELAAIDLLLLEKLEPALRAAADEQWALVRRLKLAPQLAVSYQASLRDESGEDEHAWQGVFDYGVVDRLNLAVNAGVSRIDRGAMPGETIGRLAVEAQARLNGDASTLAGLLRAGAPLVVAVSVAGAWYGTRDDIFKTQVKLTLPLPPPLEGVSLPISFTVANRTELVDEREVRGQVGFTVDLSQLRAFRFER